MINNLRLLHVLAALMLKTSAFCPHILILPLIVARQLLGKNPLIVARQRLGSVKIPVSLLGNGSVETLPRQRIHTQKYKNCWTLSFQCGPCRIKDSRRLVLPRTSCSLTESVAKFPRPGIPY
jgi:hypothetical protein